MRIPAHTCIHHTLEHSTGIMGVFFNEKIMITAVCVIALLLMAICCFVKYGDCDLTS